MGLVDTTQPASLRSIQAAIERRGDERIVLVAHAGSTIAMPLDADGMLTIGRDPGAGITIEEQTLSRVHAAIQVLGDEVWIEDMKSSNGTFLDGRQIARAMLGPGSTATLGTGVTVRLYEPTPPLPTGGLSHRQFVAELRAVLGRGDAVVVAAVALREREPLPILERLPDKNMGLCFWAWYSHDIVELASVLPGGPDLGAIARDPAVTDTVAGFGHAAAPEDGRDPLDLLHLARVRLGEAGARRTNKHAEKDIVMGEATAPLFDQIDQIASSTIPVLLLGETGVGKEVFALSLHRRGSRSAGPFVAVNCGAISRELIESAVFGHEKGAFTGATDTRPGFLEQANGGTIFLDEIGELPLDAQATLLRVLETQSFRRVGGSQEIQTDARIVCATHRDLDKRVGEGTFRVDLLYRLNSVTLRIPPLRERSDELASLASRFLSAANELHRRKVQGFTSDAMEAMRRHAWPGNLRELRNEIERAVVLGNGELITCRDLSSGILHSAVGTPEPSAERGPSLDEALRESETELILRALIKTQGNRTMASELLGLPRRTLVYKLKSLSLGPRIDRELADPRLAPLEGPTDLRAWLEREENGLVAAALAECGGKVGRAARRLATTSKRVQKVLARIET